ncbi:M20 family metallopeptidase [Ilumatobacter nonamiensis]|uniref:M20 family metallopeptidase n=1 Tax=Ilumatobacter nonamiensis TaxID=467093 RepID=UPI00034DEFB4|nr:M20/M25/M40 family metallo-hydrolase [Ilumatobacter nonamiensis]
MATSSDVDEHLAQRALALVAAPSETGQEHPAIDLIASWLDPVADEVDRWVTPMADLESDPAYPGREVERDEVPVVAARIVGNRPGPIVVLTGHADVVPVGDRVKWSRDPAGELDGDVLYGRGSADMKGGVVAAIEAFTRVAHGDRDFAGELRFVAVPGEEDGGTGTLAAIRRGWTGDLVIVPEPTSGPDGPQVVVAHGGALTYTIEVDGRSAHAATRLLGESALDHFITVYRAVERLEREVNENERNPAMVTTGLPYPTTVGVVNGGVWASNVMEKITAELRVGVTIDETVREAESRFERTLREAITGDEWLDAHPPRIERTGAAFGSSSIEVDHPLVEALRGAAESETGVRPGTIGAPYGCDMALWRREAGAACAVYGPGEIVHAHAVDERISIAELATTARVLETTVRSLLR